jgi:hypothetical protein
MGDLVEIFPVPPAFCPRLKRFCKFEFFGMGHSSSTLLLRACLVKVRVRMILYAFSYEEAVSDLSDPQWARLRSATGRWCCGRVV